jgi:hypothetical protein
MKVGLKGSNKYPQGKKEDPNSNGIKNRKNSTNGKGTIIR